VYLLFYHAESTVPSHKEAVIHSEKHVKAYEPLQLPTAHEKATKIHLKKANSITGSTKEVIESTGAATKGADFAPVKNVTEIETSKISTASDAKDSTTIKNTKVHAVKPPTTHEKATAMHLRVANSTTGNGKKDIESASVAGAAGKSADSVSANNITDFKTPGVGATNRGKDSAIKNTKGHAGSKISESAPSKTKSFKAVCLSRI